MTPFYRGCYAGTDEAAYRVCLLRGRQVLETATSAVECYLQRLEPVWVMDLLNSLLPEDRTALLYRMTLKGAAGMLVRLCRTERTGLLALLDNTTRTRVNYEIDRRPTQFYFSS